MAVHIFKDIDALGAAFAERWIDLAAQAIAARGSFHVALTGGTTPRRLYEILASPDYAGRVCWPQVHIYFGDERCVPPGHPDSNFGMADLALLSHVPLPPEQINRMQGEHVNAEEGARDYAKVLNMKVPHASAGTVEFDLVLLGLGPDGHIASLFPGTPVLLELNRPVAAVFVDSVQAWRITLTLPVIDAARCIMMLVAGDAKATIVRQALSPEAVTPLLPIHRIKPQAELEWYLDQAAAAQLPADFMA